MTSSEEIEPDSRDPTGGTEAHSRVPRATYRLQLNGAFPFTAAAQIVPYLHELGISHCYASPYLKARPGSPHGYDIVDHQALNPELGDEAAYHQFTAALRTHRMGHVLDFVPNHMGVGGSDNQWWLDVLESGPASRYAHYFDIDWRPVKEALRRKVLVPLLGDHYGQVLEDGEIRLRFDPQTGEFGVWYYEHYFPLDPSSYPALVRPHLPILERQLPADDDNLIALKSLITAFEHLPPASVVDSDSREERDRDKTLHKKRLAELYRASPQIAHYIDQLISHHEVDAPSGTPLDRLHELLERQCYRLAYWRVASDEINYRRFFDINDLAGLRQENHDVFDQTHSRVMELLAKGELQGLRIDHPDGLYDPRGYYRFLIRAARDAMGGQGSAQAQPYLVVEKILAPFESLPEDWPVDGTTGYDFLNLLNGVFVDPDGEKALTRAYEQFTGRRQSFDDLLYACKQRVIHTQLSSELTVLANLLDQISELRRHTRDYTLNGLRGALSEVVASFPVYRTYITPDCVGEQDQRYIDWAVAQAKKRTQAPDLSIFDFIRSLLLLEVRRDEQPDYFWHAVRFVMRFQQYTAPVTAKALEDTSFYIYNRLVSLNEVGGSPDRFGVTLNAFHHLNQERARLWPHSMLTTSTHDTKRSEDVRARINALSEAPGEWRRRVTRWRRINRRLRREIDGQPAPSRDDEYLLYQTLVGTWPLGGTLEPDALAGLQERIEGYAVKAAREAKTRTSWINPNAEYEEALTDFVKGLFERPERNPFLQDLVEFQAGVEHIGLLNALAQTLLKLTCPGVPDFYQGTELWDFSLVDPDNRRPVDYAQRRTLLNEIKRAVSEQGPAATVARLAGDLTDGRIKLFTIWRLLDLRAARPAVFESGGYTPLTLEGSQHTHVCAFMRDHGEEFCLVVAPRLFASLPGQAERLPVGQSVWADTKLRLPDGLAVDALTEHFTDTGVPVHRDGVGPYVALAEVLWQFPCAVLVRPAGD